MADPFGPLVEKLGFYPVAETRDVSDKVVSEFERELGQTLPDGYRDFLIHHGMTASSGLVFPDPDQPGKPAGGVGVFYGLQEGSEYNLLSEWEGTTEMIPAGLLPIADSPGGLICLMLSGDERGAVFWLAAEDSRSGGEDDFYRISHSFEDFMRSLYQYDS